MSDLRYPAHFIFSLAELTFSFFQLWDTAKVRIFLIFRGLLCAAPHLMIQGDLSLWFLPPFMFLCLQLTESFNLWLPFHTGCAYVTTHTCVSLWTFFSIFLCHLSDFLLYCLLLQGTVTNSWMNQRENWEAINTGMSECGFKISQSVWPKKLSILYRDLFVCWQLLTE